MRSLVRIGFAVALAVGLTALASHPAPAQQPAGTKSKLKAIVPLDNAELSIEDRAMKTTGKVREFEIPAVDAGKTYEYALKATWRPNNYTVITRTKTVTFKGGEDVTVDLTKDDPKDRVVIRFVPTPDDIVDRMIKLAAVKDTDVVFEPGCGDARITIAAVKAGAKKGVGVDIDKERVAEANANVKKAGVEKKVEIREGDALDIKDLDQASVVFLYMGNEFDMLIRPILWKQLKVGSRVVSHRFEMGDWKPDRTETVKGEDGDEYQLHLWTITEDVKKRASEAPAKPADKDKPKDKEKEKA